MKCAGVSTEGPLDPGHPKCEGPAVQNWSSKCKKFIVPQSFISGSLENQSLHSFDTGFP